MKILHAPASKSYSHRYLLCAAMSAGKSVLHNLLYADDSMATMGCLDTLGVKYKEYGKGSIEIDGLGGRVATSLENPFFVRDSATLSRVLPFLLSTQKGEFCIQSGEQLSNRSHKELPYLLKQINADITFLLKENVPPFQIKAHGICTEYIECKEISSSQYISGLLMSAPLLSRGLCVRMNIKKVASFPYIVMTLMTLQDFSIPFTIKNENSGRYISLEDVWNMSKEGRYSEDISIHIKASQYNANEYTIPSDWSNISYIIAIALLGKEKIRIKGSILKSYQGDSDFVKIVRTMGGNIEEEKDSIIVSPSKLRARDIDMHNYPDIVPTLAILFAFSEGKSTISSIGTLRSKETDRISAISNVLSALGVYVEEGEDYIRIEGSSKIVGGKRISTYNDHRIAMACGIIKAIGIDIEIENMDCVNKSYPAFWKDIGKEER
ncbi:MAG: 3-phosphoshikimate 1-carboxyvinyltransferase [Desulfovibrionaceae bacterium]